MLPDTSNQSLDRQELEMLFIAASQAARHGNEEEVLRVIFATFAEKGVWQEGTIHITVGQRSLTVGSTKEARQDILTALHEVTKQTSPFVQAGFSAQKIVTLRMGETFVAVPLSLEGSTIGAIGFVVRGVATREDVTRQLAFVARVSDLLAGTVVERMLQKNSLLHLKEENFSLRQSLRELEGAGRSHRLIGESTEMRRVYREIAQVAEAETTVIIRGETGTGKELVARAIHEKSGRAQGPCITINCAALPESLLESELFGYEKGAFTGALTARKGSFELADGGSLFLDEIGEMSFEAQARLLRVLQEKEIQPIGGRAPRKVDVRLICATNRDLEEAVAHGRFRQDLYYRINVFPIDLPPLRERLSDLTLLAQLFIDTYGKDQKGITISSEALQILSNYTWPGNVRELENVMQRALLIAKGEAEIGRDHLPHLLVRAVEMGTTVLLGASSFEDQVARFEKDLIEDALEQTQGNQTKAAELLQTTKRVIQYKSQKYGIVYQQYRH